MYQSCHVGATLVVARRDKPRRGEFTAVGDKPAPTRGRAKTAEPVGATLAVARRDKPRRGKFAAGGERPGPYVRHMRPRHMRPYILKSAASDQRGYWNVAGRFFSMKK